MSTCIKSILGKKNLNNSMWLQQNVKKLNTNSTFADPLEFASPGGHLGAFWSSTEQSQTELTGLQPDGFSSVSL